MQATVLDSSATANTTDLPPPLTAWWQNGCSESQRPRLCAEAGGGAKRGAPGEPAHWAWRRVLHPSNGPARHAEWFGTPSPAAFKRGAGFIPQMFEKTASLGGRERCLEAAHPLLSINASSSLLGKSRPGRAGDKKARQGPERPGEPWAPVTAQMEGAGVSVAAGPLICFPMDAMCLPDTF